MGAEPIEGKNHRPQALDQPSSGIFAGSCSPVVCHLPRWASCGSMSASTRPGSGEKAACSFTCSSNVCSCLNDVKQGSGSVGDQDYELYGR